MAKVKTPILTGAEVCVEDLGGQNVAVKNLGKDLNNIIKTLASSGEESLRGAFSARYQ